MCRGTGSETDIKTIYFSRGQIGHTVHASSGCNDYIFGKNVFDSLKDSMIRNG